MTSEPIVASVELLADQRPAVIVRRGDEILDGWGQERLFTDAPRGIHTFAWEIESGQDLIWGFACQCGLCGRVFGAYVSQAASAASARDQIHAASEACLVGRGFTMGVRPLCSYCSAPSGANPDTTSWSIRIAGLGLGLVKLDSLTPIEGDVDG